MNKFKNFVSPHCHIQSLDTGSTIDRFAARELELQTGYMTCTDHGYLGACLDTYKIAKENGLTPIIGIEAYHRDDNCPILKECGIEKDPDNTYKKYYKYGHLTIHCLDQKAYHKLIGITSRAEVTAEKHGSEKKPIFTWKDLEELGAENVTITSGCLAGIISRHIQADRPDIALKYYEKLRSLVKPGNFYVELFCHRCDKNWVNGVFIDLENGEKLRYHSNKKVKVDSGEEIPVSQLAKMFSKNGNVGSLRAVKNYHTWQEVVPSKIIKCVQVEDFIQNECKPWCPDGDVQLGANKILVEYAKKYGDKIIISDDAHYASNDEKVVQEAKLSGLGDSFRFYGDYYRHSSDEAFAYFSKYMGFSESDFRELVRNNEEWAEKFKDFNIKYDISLPKSFYPSDTLNHLKFLIDKHGRMDWKDEKRVERLKSEIELLHNNGEIDLLPYFFLAEEVPELYTEAEELVGPGRGSAGGLFVSYLLEITHADPLYFGLSKDRFLTIPRIKGGKLPDIDQDLPHRDLLIPWLKNRFGDHVAQISTNQLLRLKNCIKDVARATMGKVPRNIEILCENLPGTPQGVEDLNFIFGYRGEDGKEVKGLIDTNKHLIDYVKTYPKQWEVVQKMLRIVKAKARHASAFIVADKPIDKFIPLMSVEDFDLRVTQYTAKSCEAAGALKMDYLVVNTLKDIGNTLKMIRQKYRPDLPKSVIINGKKVPKVRVLVQGDKLHDIYDLPEDQDVFDEICAGNTSTIFQLNTFSAIKGLKEFNFNDANGKKLINSVKTIAEFIALDRPGPLDAVIEDDGKTRNMLEESAARKRGLKPLAPIQFLEEILPETNGVIVYQEQVTRVYQTLTGCDGVEADKFREKTAKKKVEEVIALYPSFMEKASKIVEPEIAQRIWDQLNTFSQYGFNLSHAVCYALIGYASAYLKHHFPQEWWCSVLANCKKQEIAEKFWTHCRHLVELPSLEKSDSNFKVIGDKIIAPINIIQGIGDKAHEEIMEFKPYTSIEDLCNKIDLAKNKYGRSALNSGVTSKLIISGALDSLFPPNLNTLSKLEKFNEEIARIRNKKKPERVKEEYANLSGLSLYQYRKKINPLYSENVIPLIYSHEFDGLKKNYLSNDTEYYSFMPESLEVTNCIMKSFGSKSMFKHPLPVITSNKLLTQLNQSSAISKDGTLKVVAGAYVLKYNPFHFFERKTGRPLTAYRFLLDIDGDIYSFTKWPNMSRENYLPTSELENAIILAVLGKRKENYPFTIEAIVPVKLYEGKEEKENGKERK